MDRKDDGGQYGTGAAADVLITDTLPAFVTLVSTSPMYDSFIGGVLTWDLGTVAGGVSGPISVEVTVDAGTDDEVVLTNVVVLNYNDPNGNPQPPEDDTTTVTVTAPMR